MRKLFLLFVIVFVQLNGESFFSSSLSKYSVDVIEGSYVDVKGGIDISGPKPFRLNWVYTTKVTSFDGSFTPNWHWQIVEIEEGGLPLKLVKKYDNKERLIEAAVHSLSSKQPISFVKIHYHSKKISIFTHDEQTVEIILNEEGLPSSILVHKAIRAEYRYQNGRIVEKHTGSNRSLINEYYTYGTNDVGGRKIKITSRNDPRIGKVKCQRAPIGTVSNPRPVASYFYHEGRTEVVDSLGRVTEYGFDPKTHMLHSVKQLLPTKKAYRTKRFSWRPSSLTERYLISLYALENERGEVLTAESYAYDRHDRLIKETLHGNLTGDNAPPLLLSKDGTVSGGESYSRYREYGSDGALVKKWEDNGKAYEYYRNGDHVIELFAHEGRVLRRTAEFFDREGLLVRKLADDGNSPSIDCLDGVTERRLVDFQNSVEPASFGQPLLIEEKVLDLKTLQEAEVKTQHRRFDRNGRLEFEETVHPDGSLLENSYSYDEEGNPNVILHKDGSCIQREYDSEGNVLLTANREMVRETLYDYQNHPIQEIKTEQKTEKKELALFYYNAEGELVKKTDSQGNDTEIEVDDFGRIVKKRMPKVLDEDEREYRPEITYAYDPFDQIVAASQNGRTTSYRYNLYGNVAEVLHPDGASELFRYFPDGSLREEIDRKGIKTVYERDPFDRPVRITRTSLQGDWTETIEKEYTPFRLIRERGPNGSWTEYRYDASGRLVKKEIPLKEGTAKTAYHYDTSGKLKRTDKWYGNQEDAFTTVSTKRDERGNILCHAVEGEDGETLLEMEPPGQELGKEPVRRVGSRINERGQKVLRATEVKPDGSTVILTYDAIDQLEKKEVMSPFGEVLSKQEFRYDRYGNKAKQTDTVYFRGEAIGTRATRWEYDSSGQLVKWIESADTRDQRITSYRYDRYGNKTETCRPDGTVLFFSYTPGNRLERLSSSDGTVDYEYTYDAEGRLQASVDRIHDQSFSRTYHDLGGVASETFYGLFTFHNHFDLQGNRTELTLPDGSKVLYSYENTLLKEVLRLDANNEESYRFSYDSYTLQGRPLETTMIRDAGKLEYTRDMEGFLSSLSSPCFHERITKRDCDHREKILSLEFTDPIGEEEVEYAYDNLGQLTRENNVPYEADSLYCHRLFQGKDRLYDGERLTHSENRRYLYDCCGNLIEQHDGKSRSAYTYDALNRLVRVDIGSLAIRFFYDGCHRRLKKEVFDRRTGKKETVRYLYDGSHEIGTLNEEGKIVELRILGLGMGAEIGASIALELGKNVYAPVHDHRGNIVCLIDTSTNEAAETIRYSAFGEKTEGDFLSPWRFASKRVDTETGLAYFGKRYYSQDMGRWITEDPLGFIDTPNRYAYAKNDPISFVDPQGFFSIRSLFSDLYSASMNFFSHLVEHFLNEVNHFDPVESVNQWMEHLGISMLGTMLMQLSGNYQGESFSGTWVNRGEMYENCRVTFINGINTNLENLYSALERISNSHRGTNVHFCFNATCGWTRDMFKSLWLKVGFVTEEADHLAGLWKRLLDEMEDGKKKGFIYHYAHSLGGTITLRARELISLSELKRIHVVTFGSSSIIPDVGFGSSINFISRRDGVTPLSDPFTYILSILEQDAHVVLIGSSILGPPLIDHLFDTYWDYWILHYWHLFEEFLQSI